MFSFGKKKTGGADTKQAQSDAPASAAKSSPETDPNLIRVFDEFGRELFITKEQWRTNVLPGSLQSNWNNPDQLYGIIIGSLNDGFFADVLDAAKHLYEIDPVTVRGACAYGIVLMKNNQLDDAESVFLAHIRKHGEDGIVLTNLAKVYAARNETQMADETLWKALTLDPNQENGLNWYAANCRERFGKEAWLESIARVAELPGSWRAQLWLARAALDAGDIAKALTFYQHIRAVSPPLKWRGNETLTIPTRQPPACGAQRRPEGMGVPLVRSPARWQPQTPKPGAGNAGTISERNGGAKGRRCTSG